MKIAVRAGYNTVLLSGGLPRSCCCPTTGVAECANPCAYRVAIGEIDSADVVCGDLDEEYQGAGYEAYPCSEFNITPAVNTGLIYIPAAGFEGIVDDEEYQASRYYQVLANTGLANSGPFSGFPSGYYSEGISGYSVTPPNDPNNQGGTFKVFSRELSFSFRCQTNSEFSCAKCENPEENRLANVWRISVFQRLTGSVSVGNVTTTRTIERLVEDHPLVVQDCSDLGSFPPKANLRWCGEAEVVINDCEFLKDFHIGDLIEIEATAEGVIVTIGDQELEAIPWDSEDDTGALDLPEPFDVTPVATVYTGPCCCWDEEDESDERCNPLP
jgi:hypothetical protein